MKRASRAVHSLKLNDFVLACSANAGIVTKTTADRIKCLIEVTAPLLDSVYTSAIGAALLDAPPSPGWRPHGERSGPRDQLLLEKTNVISLHFSSGSVLISRCVSETLITVCDIAGVSAP